MFPARRNLYYSAMPRFQMIGFDADDTLWHNEKLYVAAQSRYRQLMMPYSIPDKTDQELHLTEMRNLDLFGYGIKGFALSMMETAVHLSDGRLSGADVRGILDITRTLLSADVELLDHAAETVSLLADERPLILITKGDLRDQESKIKRSGLAPHFKHVEILSNKRKEDYAALLDRYQLAPSRFVMVGNSLRSDIWPVLELGGNAVYVPHDFTWAHEEAPLPPSDHHGYHAIEHLGLLPGVLERLEGQGHTDRVPVLPPKRTTGGR
jgi:putative hydrolase of the HAD superfamily